MNKSPIAVITHNVSDYEMNLLITLVRNCFTTQQANRSFGVIIAPCYGS